MRVGKGPWGLLGPFHVTSLPQACHCAGPFGSAGLCWRAGVTEGDDREDGETSNCPLIINFFSSVFRNGEWYI